MARHGVKRIVFSSSATVYGEPERLPLAEDHPLRPASPYGKTKLVIEHMLADAAAAEPGFAHAALRYFNPIGAHPSGRIGEDPRGVPNNLFPYLTQVAAGRLPKLRVFGADYPTADGSGVRDYIHVLDLAAGHLAALAYLAKNKRSITANLGTGRGYSVLETVRAFERATGVQVPLRGRRAPPGRHRELLRRRLARRAPRSAGARGSGWRTCAATRGAGSPPIRPAIRARIAPKGGPADEISHRRLRRRLRRVARRCRRARRRARAQVLDLRAAHARLRHRRARAAGQEIEKKSGGAVTVRVFAGNSPFGKVVNQADQVKQGVVDLAFGLNGIPRGRYPRTSIMEMPFVAESADLATPHAVGDARRRAGRGLERLQARGASLPQPGPVPHPRQAPRIDLRRQGPAHARAQPADPGPARVPRRHAGRHAAGTGVREPAKGRHRRRGVPVGRDQGLSPREPAQAAPRRARVHRVLSPGDEPAALRRPTRRRCKKRSTARSATRW